MLHISPPPAPLGNINDVLGSAESLLMMIQSRKNIRDRECFFNLTDGGSLQCMLSAAPIPNDKGMVLFLHEASKAQRLAAHSVGAKAIYTFSSIIGESPSLQKAIELSKVASHSNITTLILGESGTGKELFAHAIHNASPRRHAPFVAVNCGALPESLLEAVEARGVMARWVARDTTSKRYFDITTDSVCISTIHSAKGLDFSHVFLLGMDRLQPEKPRQRRLAYVGMTRAREHLTLAICGREGLVPVLTAAER